MNARVLLHESKTFSTGRSWYRKVILQSRELEFDSEERLGLTKTAVSKAFGQLGLARRSATAPFLPILSLLACLGAPPSVPAQKDLPTSGIVREFTASFDEVRQAVVAVQKDHIIHGTIMFDREPTLTGAEAATSSVLFEPWKGKGEVYYKIRRNAIAPRHFSQTADQGTIGVRYVIIPVSEDRVRVQVDAVYVESSHKVVHASDGTVEKSELKEIKEALDSMQQAAAEAADARRRELSAELVRQSYARQREDETARLEKAQANAKNMEQEIKDLRHELERRVKAPGADLKAAPFQAAANLKTLAAYTEVVVLIVSPHWLGVETPEGQRGWLPIEQLEPLP